jgi:ribosomal-protein-alanine N-acetyltransferase
LAEAHIRPAAPADIDPVKHLEPRCFEIPWGRLSIEGELTAAGGGGYVLCRPGSGGAAGEVLGYLFYRLIVDEVHIHRVAVAPEWRRRGWGARLMAACLDAARRRGATAAVLEVRPSNAEAVALYRKLGFEAAATRPGYYADGAEDALILKLDIKEEL